MFEGKKLMLPASRMKASRLALLPLVALAAIMTVRVAAQTEQETAREMFVGVYALSEYAAHGDEPSGRIWYDRGGQMSALLFPPGREPLGNAASAEDFRASMRGVIAYYGSYTVDVEAGTVTHHIEGASNPSWIGDDFVRWYRFEDGDLRLSLNAEFQNTLLWDRLPSQ